MDSKGPAAKRIGWSTYIKETAQYGGPALGLIALALYAAVRFAYDGFYSELSIRPEDVGVDYISILTRAALGGIVFGSILFLPTFTVGPALVSFLRRHGGRYVASGAILIGIGGFSLYLDLNYPLDVASRDYSVDFVTAALGFGVVIAGVVVMRRPSTERSVQPTSLENVFAAVAVVLLITISLAFSARYGEANGRQVQDDKTIGSEIFSLVDFYTERVCVEWIGLDSPPNLDLSTSMIYLGQSGGIGVIYRPRGRGLAPPGPIRVPMIKVVLTPTVQSASSCP